MDKKKRKMDSEGCIFNQEWGIKYFFIHSNEKALCLICCEHVAVLKEYNLRRHYETKHERTYAQYTGAQRSQKFEQLQRNLLSQRAMFTQRNTENESVTRASYIAVYELAKCGKPFSNGEVFKDCMIKVAAELSPEKVHLYKMLSLSSSTVACRVEDIGSNIIHQIAEKAKNFEVFSLALDESTDVCDTSQLLVFLRGIDSEFNVSQELASVHSMHGTVTGEDIFKELEKTLLEYKLEWRKLKCVTIDGGKNMSGIKNGLVGQITKCVEGAGLSKPMFLHCIIHQQALCLKYVDMTCVLKPVVAIVNFIKAQGLNHQQFREFLKEIDSEFTDVLYYTAVRWLSCGKVLLRFFQLREEIKIFLEEKNHSEPLLSDSCWIVKLAFFADLTDFMNKLNMSLQKETNLICDIFTAIKSFRSKLMFFQKEIQTNFFSYFPCSARFCQETKTAFPSSFATEVLSDLQKQFKVRFADLYTKTEDIKMFENPVDSDAVTVPHEYKLEIIDLQSDNLLIAKHKEGDLVQFYKSLPSEKYQNLKRFGCEYISVFGTTYLCEQAFSRMKYIKSKYRSNLSDEHLKAQLIIGSSNLEPQYHDILKNKHQMHHSY